MTTLYLVSNNCVVNNLNYASHEVLELKRERRPLSIEGEELSRKLCEIDELKDINVIFSSGYASAIGTSKYLADKLELDININNQLNERKIGLIEDKSLRFFKNNQEHDFDYRLSGGESINSTKKRLTAILGEIVNNYQDMNILVVTHNVAIISYLLNFCERGYNLEDRLILNYNEKVIVDGTVDKLELFKIEIEQKEVKNIEKNILN